eukprot:6513-Eustigmatos_ZCMA.PRE.1
MAVVTRGGHAGLVQHHAKLCTSSTSRVRYDMPLKRAQPQMHLFLCARLLMKPRSASVSYHQRQSHRCKSSAHSGYILWSRFGYVERRERWWCELGRP